MKAAVKAKPEVEYKGPRHMVIGGLTYIGAGYNVGQWVLAADDLAAAIASVDDIVNDSRYEDEEEDRLEAHYARTHPGSFHNWLQAREAERDAWENVKAAAKAIEDYNKKHGGAFSDIVKLAKAAAGGDADAANELRFLLQQDDGDGKHGPELRRLLETLMKAIPVYNQSILETYFSLHGHLPCDQRAKAACEAGQGAGPPGSTCAICRGWPCTCVFYEVWGDGDDEWGEWPPPGKDGKKEDGKKEKEAAPSGSSGSGPAGSAGAHGNNGQPSDEADSAPGQPTAGASPAGTNASAAVQDGPGPTKGPDRPRDEQVGGASEGRKVEQFTGALAAPPPPPPSPEPVAPAAAAGDPDGSTSSPTRTPVRPTAVRPESQTPTDTVPPKGFGTCESCAQALAAQKTGAMDANSLLQCFLLAASKERDEKGRPLTHGLDVASADPARLLRELIARCRKQVAGTGDFGIALQEEKTGEPATPGEGPRRKDCWTSVVKAKTVEELGAIAKGLPAAVKDKLLTAWLRAGNIKMAKGRLKVHCLRQPGESTRARNRTIAPKDCVEIVKAVKNLAKRGKIVAATDELVRRILEAAPHLLEDEEVSVAAAATGVILDPGMSPEEAGGPAKYIARSVRNGRALVDLLSSKFLEWCKDFDSSPPGAEESPPKRLTTGRSTSEDAVRKNAKKWFPAPPDGEDKCRTYARIITTAFDEMRRTGNFSAGGTKSYTRALSLGDGRSLANAIRPPKLLGVLAQESAFNTNVGRSKKTIGPFQIQSDVLVDYNRLNKSAVAHSSMRTFAAAARVAAWYLAYNAMLLTFNRKAAGGPVTDPEELNKFTLAAYNGGIGRIQKARERARSAGRDSGKWSEVRNYLTKAGATKAKHDEIVEYVWNIRYYERLVEHWGCLKRSAR